MTILNFANFLPIFYQSSHNSKSAQLTKKIIERTLLEISRRKFWSYEIKSGSEVWPEVNRIGSYWLLLLSITYRAWVAKSMLVTDSGDEIYWWQLGDVEDWFEMLINDSIHKITNITVTIVRSSFSSFGSLAKKT